MSKDTPTVATAQTIRDAVNDQTFHNVTDVFHLNGGTNADPSAGFDITVDGKRYLVQVTCVS